MNKIFESKAVRWFWILTAAHYVCVFSVITAELIYPFTKPLYENLGELLNFIDIIFFTIEFFYIMLRLFIPVHIVQVLLFIAYFNKCDKRNIPLLLLGFLLTIAGMYFTYRAYDTCMAALWI